MSYERAWSRIEALKALGQTSEAVEKEEGIRERAALSSVTHFDFAAGFPQDYMHDVLQGVLVRVCELLCMCAQAQLHLLHSHSFFYAGTRGGVSNV